MVCALLNLSWTNLHFMSKLMKLFLAKKLQTSTMKLYQQFLDQKNLKLIQLVLKEIQPERTMAASSAFFLTSV